MLNNLKIGTRLMGGFAIVVILMIVVGVLGIARLAELNHEIDDMANDKYPKVEKAVDMIRAMNQVSIINRNTLLIKDEAELAKQRARRDEQRKIIGERIEQLEKVVTSDAGKKLMSDIKEKRAAFVIVLDKFIATNQSGNHDGATKMLYTEMRGATDAYLNSIRELVKFQDGLMEKAAKDAKADYEQARAIMIGLIVGALVLAIVIALWITRGITRPVGEALDVTQRLADGDLTVRIDATSKDEIGQMLAAQQSLIAKLNQIIGEVKTSADALSNASGQVSATAQSLSQSSSEQAASVEETTASIEEMTASITQNTENAKVTDNMATKSATQAEQGGAAVKDTAHFVSTWICPRFRHRDSMSFR